MENRNVTSACAPAPSTATRSLFFRLENIAAHTGRLADRLESAVDRLGGSAPSGTTVAAQKCDYSGVLGEYETEVQRADHHLDRLADLADRLERLV